MKTIVTSRIEFESWEQAYLQHIGYDVFQIGRWRDCVEEFDSNVFSTKEARCFRNGYLAAEKDYSYDQ